MTDKDLSEDEARALLDQLLGKVSAAASAREGQLRSDGVEAPRPKAPAPPAKPAGPPVPAVGRPRRAKP